MTTTNVDPALADKLADREAQQAAGVAVAKREKTIFDLIRDNQAGYARALPSMITPERFVRVAITAIRTKPALARCNRQSLLGALMLSAQLGLEPSGPLGHAYLVPFGNEVTFILGYKGMIDLARRSGAVSSVYAEAVFEGDEFHWTLGLHRDIEHKPTATVRDDPSKITHVYAVARFKDAGEEPSFVVLDRAQVEKFRARSKTPKKGPWVDDWQAMALKTAVRRLATWLPMSVELSRGVAADEQVITKLDVDADDFIDVEGDELEAGDELAAGASDAADPSPGADGVPSAPDRMAEAVSLRTGALAADQAAYTTWAKSAGVPTDSRKWTPEHVEAVIAWCTADPADDEQPAATPTTQP